MQKPSNADPRTRGRVPAEAERVKTTLLLDLDTVEWGKRQPGGLSETIRQLLREKYEAEKSTRDRDVKRTENTKGLIP